MTVVVEAVAVGNLAVDATDRKVHLRQLPGGVVGLLAVDGYVGFRPAAVAVPRRMGADELYGLDEHARRAATGVVDAAVVRLQHLHQQAHDGARGVELAALLALGAGELGEEVLIDSSQDVPGAGFLIPYIYVADEVHQLAQARLVESGTCVVFG